MNKQVSILLEDSKIDEPALPPRQASIPLAERPYLKRFGITLDFSRAGESFVTSMANPSSKTPVSFQRSVQLKGEK